MHSPRLPTGIDSEPALTRLLFSLITAFGLYTIIYDLALLLSWSLATTMMIWTLLLAASAIYWQSKSISGAGSALLNMRRVGRDCTLLCLFGDGTRHWIDVFVD